MTTMTFGATTQTQTQTMQRKIRVQRRVVERGSTMPSMESRTKAAKRTISEVISPRTFIAGLLRPSLRSA